MTRIALVVSDVDGTLLTKDKVLTDGAKAAVQKLHDEPLSITLPIGAFNGSSIVDSKLGPIEQHLIPPAVAQRSLDVLNAFGVDIWLFTNDRWYTRNPDGEYVPHEKLAIKADPTIVTDFTPHLTKACKIVGASSDFARLQRCEAAMKEAVGREATAVRSQNYYLDVIATIGDMENDLPMFAKSGISFAMGNAADNIKQRATHVTDSNERDGFAAAIETVLQLG
jgi:hydroxymethylpyrimidine pyrophosphatase-like HAD family hydrolase